MKNPRSLRMLVAILGVLSVAGAVVFNAGFVGQTLANWNDRVFGASSFGVEPADLQGYARSIAGRVAVDRVLTGGAGVGATATKTAQDPGHLRTPGSDWLRYEGSGLLGGGFVGVQSTACASYRSTDGACGDSGSSTNAVAQAQNIALRTGDSILLGLDVLTSTSNQVLTTSASCIPGQAPVASGISPSGAALTLHRLLVLGQDRTLAVPQAPLTGGTASTQATVTAIGIPARTATLTHTTVVGEKSASSTLRLHVAGSGWTVEMIVLHAECGIGVGMPPPPTMSASGVSRLATMMLDQQEDVVCLPGVKSETELEENPAEEAEVPTTATGESLSDPVTVEDTVDGGPIAADESDPGPVSCEPTSDEPGVVSPLDLLVEDGVIDEAEPQSELVDRDEDVEVNAADAPVDGLEDRVESELGDGRTTDEVATDVESAPAEDAGVDESQEPTTPDGDTPGERDESPSADTGTTTAEPTASSSSPAPEPAPTSQPSGPTTPTRVSTGAPFRMVATDGSDLGRVTVAGISRSSGCVAVRLEITTSDGSGNTVLNGLHANDFREVLDDGGSAPVGAPNGGCDAGSSLPTSFAPNTTYSGWVAFGVVNGSNSVMLRPAGTAGWIIGLPAVAAPTTAAVPTPTDTDEPAVETDAPSTTDTTVEDDASGTATSDEPADA